MSHHNNTLISVQYNDINKEQMFGKVITLVDFIEHDVIREDTECTQNILR